MQERQIVNIKKILIKKKIKKIVYNSYNGQNANVALIPRCSKLFLSLSVNLHIANVLPLKNFC